MEQEKIGKFIAYIRKSKGLSQKELANKLGISNYTVSNWENGKSLPNYELLIPLTKELDISISELINGEKNVDHEEPNKTIEKVIKFLKYIEDQKRKKYKMVGIIIVGIGILIKILTMIFIKSFVYYSAYYLLLSYIIVLIGFAYINHKEKVKTMLLKTFKYGIITLLLFICIDILEIKLCNTPPRYATRESGYHLLRYYQTPFYDAYFCSKHILDLDSVGQEYKIIPRKYKILTGDDFKEMEKKYCK